MGVIEGRDKGWGVRAERDVLLNNTPVPLNKAVDKGSLVGGGGVGTRPQ